MLDQNLQAERVMNQKIVFFESFLKETFDEITVNVTT